mmetsp:Transcript_116118/g.369469  ORF Transcript_116118/g.369469 Transcript_116118/m.369469 type:complete len:328 (-) Transcript_116118:2220-3203(-)
MKADLGLDPRIQWVSVVSVRIRAHECGIQKVPVDKGLTILFEKKAQRSEAIVHGVADLEGPELHGVAQLPRQLPMQPQLQHHCQGVPEGGREAEAEAKRAAAPRPPVASHLKRASFLLLPAQRLLDVDLPQPLPERHAEARGAGSQRVERAEAPGEGRQLAQGEGAGDRLVFGDARERRQELLVLGPQRREAPSQVRQRLGVSELVGVGPADGNACDEVQHPRGVHPQRRQGPSQGAQVLIVQSLEVAQPQPRGHGVEFVAAGAEGEEGRHQFGQGPRAEVVHRLHGLPAPAHEGGSVDGPRLGEGPDDVAELPPLEAVQLPSSLTE